MSVFWLISSFPYALRYLSMGKSLLKVFLVMLLPPGDVNKALDGLFLRRSVR